MSSPRGSEPRSGSLFVEIEGVLFLEGALDAAGRIGRISCSPGAPAPSTQLTCDLWWPILAETPQHVVGLVEAKPPDVVTKDTAQQTDSGRRIIRSEMSLPRTETQIAPELDRPVGMPQAARGRPGRCRSAARRG